MHEEKALLLHYDGPKAPVLYYTPPIPKHPQATTQEVGEEEEEEEKEKEKVEKVEGKVAKVNVLTLVRDPFLNAARALRVSAWA